MYRDQLQDRAIGARDKGWGLSFLRSPVELLSTSTASGRVDTLRLGVNKLVVCIIIMTTAVKA